VRNDLSNLSSIIAAAERMTPAPPEHNAPSSAQVALAAEGMKLNPDGTITPHDGVKR
jgi:hypothetical protein